MENINWLQMSATDKIESAERMYGTGSKQHLQALARFTK